MKLFTALVLSLFGFLPLAGARSATASVSCDLPGNASVYVFTNRSPAIGMILVDGANEVSYYVSGTDPYVDTDTGGAKFSLDVNSGSFSGIGPDGETVSGTGLECGG